MQDLRKAGGYLTLYSGSAKSRKGTISFQQAQDFARKLSHFLTFLNGNKITPVVIAGKFKRKKIWEYYPETMSHEYRDVLSWTDFKQNGMETIWNSILKFHADPDRLDVLTSLLNWYVSANRNAVHVEGAIVMVQNALELLYNFIVIGEAGILSEDDSEKLPAAAKIRLLLAQLKVEFAIPGALSNLQSFSKTLSNSDGPAILTEIRNAIVHGGKRKRNTLKKANLITRVEAKNLAIWYVEIALLYLLQYNGSYKNRCTGKVNKVPWSTN